MKTSTLLQKIPFAFGVLLAISGFSQTNWDLAGDWNPPANPNSVWTYGYYYDGSFVTDTAYSPNFFAGYEGPNTGIYLNSSETIYGIAAGQVGFQADAGNPVARWTAPISGVFNITVLIGGTAADEGGGYGNAFAQYAGLNINLVPQPAVSFINNVMNWTFSNIWLNAGTTVDAFVTNPGHAGGGNTQTIFHINLAFLLNWANPNPILYGTALTTNQLNATASIPGMFAYTPASGAVLNAGTNTLSVVFTPSDTVDYTSVSNTVSLVVLTAPLVVTASNATRAYGQTNPVFTAAIVGLTNGDNIAATNSCAATVSTPPGKYLIVPSLVDPNDLEANYNVTLIDGTLTVLSPQIQFTAQPTNGLAPLTMQFNSPGMDSSGTLISQWQWNFGDGATSTAQNPAHAYTQPGFFSPSLVATNANGIAAYGTGPPISVFGSVSFMANPTNGSTPLTVAFSSPSQDSSGLPISQWNWNFGDGATSTAQNPAYTYTNAGYFSPTLVTMDSNGIFDLGIGPAISASVIYTVLHSFSGSDGAGPSGNLVTSGNTLYGTAAGGGTSGAGTVFAVNLNGTAFTNLYSFSGGSDGASPQGGLVVSNNTLFGTAAGGGARSAPNQSQIGTPTFGLGTAFRINLNATGFANLGAFDSGGWHPMEGLPLADYFTNRVGADPSGTLAISGSALYGTAADGGMSGDGTVFDVNISGSGFSALHSFDGNDGTSPQGTLAVWGSTLYGTASRGGTSGDGTVFTVSINGSGFSTLHSFDGNDGANPEAGVIVAGNTLYGTTRGGGANGAGVVFSININGTGFTNLYNFTGGNDGANPTSSLLLYGHTLYGTAENGGVHGVGTVFAVNTDGTGFTTLWAFSHEYSNSSGSLTNIDGANPEGGLLLSSNTFYGTTTAGGSTGNGTVFSLEVTSLPAYPKIIGQFPTTNYLYTAAGATEALSVTATGTSLQYQWFSNSVPMSGATNSSLFLTNIVSAMNGSSYWAVVSNSVASVSNTPVELLVVLAASQLPTGYWPGVGYWPNVPMTYTIKAGPPPGTVVYAVQEQLASYPDNTETNGLATKIIVGAISDGGTFDANNYIIKWGPFFDDSPRTLTYVLTPPRGTTNWAVFSGIISIDGNNYPVMGDNEINLLPLHPADNGGKNSWAIDSTISIDEMAKYACDWRAGNLWPVEPNPIPIDYMTSAGFIWSQHSGYYVYDPSVGDPPNCWVSTNPPPGYAQSLPAANPTNSASTVVSSMPAIYTNNVPFTVTLTVTPTNNTMAYAVEDQVPAGWTVININNSGVYSSFDSYNNEVKWGPIFDTTPTALTYQVIPPANATGAAAFAGVASFDGASIPITGVRQVSPSIVPQPGITGISLSGANLVINGTNGASGGTYFVLMSTNLKMPLNQWTPVATNTLNATGNFTITATNAVDAKAPQRFYILQMQ